MGKNLVILSDGTGQEGGVGNNTNVYDLFNMIEDRTRNQVSFYDRGLGTDRSKIGRLSGFGISRNVHECYQFLADGYAAGDRIFLFGFSRGATTVRTLSGFIELFGILPRSRPELIRRAWQIYRIGDPDRRRRQARQFVQLNHTMWTRVRFLGVWDTVAALGLPIKTLDVIIDKIPFLRHSFHDLTLAPGVEHARHALAIDDERKDFHPQLWSEPEPAAGAGRQADVQGFTVEDVDDVYLVAEKLKDRDHPLTRRLRQLERLEPATRRLLGAFNSAGRSEPPERIEGLARAVVRDFNRAVYSVDVSLFEPRAAAELDGLALSPATRELMDRFDETDRTAAQRLDRRLLEEAYSLRPGDRPRVKQVWFAGMHTDVGGGYPEPELAHVPLLWMVREAIDAGLRIYPRHRVDLRPDPTGTMHDSRAGLGRLYRRKPRRWSGGRGAGPLVHESVVLRSRGGARYEPWSLGDGRRGEGRRAASSYEPWILQSDHGLEPWPKRLAMSVQFDDHHIWREPFWGWDSAFVVPWRAIDRISCDEKKRVLILHLLPRYERYRHGPERGQIRVEGCLPDALPALVEHLEERHRQRRSLDEDQRLAEQDVQLADQHDRLETMLEELQEKVARLEQLHGESAGGDEGEADSARAVGGREERDGLQH